jgi:hypothetical protein
MPCFTSFIPFFLSYAQLKHQHQNPVQNFISLLTTGQGWAGAKREEELRERMSVGTSEKTSIRSDTILVRQDLLRNRRFEN